MASLSRRISLGPAMADFIKLKTKITGILNKPGTEIVSRATADDLGKSIVARMKKMITAGISTIEGNGRFPKYKHAGKPDKYPAIARGDYPNKRQSPVNLTLSGEMLKNLSSTPVRTGKNWGPEISYTGDAALKESGHREGVRGQPKRPTIPDARKGEKFNQTIMSLITETFTKAMSDFLKKGK